MNSSDVCDATSLMRALESFGFGVAIGEAGVLAKSRVRGRARLISTESGDDLREIEAQRATISARRPASSRPSGTPEHGEDFEAARGSQRAKRKHERKETSAKLESVQTFC